jgi:uncharacterized protein YukE
MIHRSPSSPPVPTALHTLLTRLRTADRRRALLDEGARDALLLAEALLAAHIDAPLQIAVIGPTQTGKSTVVNLLLGAEHAAVSPLAGFTVHPQGFWVQAPTAADAEKPASQAEPLLFDLSEPAEPADAPPAWIADLLPGWQRSEPRALSAEQLEAYALAATPPTEAGMPAECVVWDTPDFDSLAARQYRRGLLATLALADAYVLVVSKEKYADLTVWRMLDLLAPLGRPLVLCLNKLSPDGADTIAAQVVQRLSAAPAWQSTPLVRLPYTSAGALAGEPVADLRNRVTAALKLVDRSTHAAGVRALVDAHWDAWTTAIAAEHAALAEWEQLVASELDDLAVAYQAEYLEHPQRFDSFRRATLELLQLLELPGVGGPLSAARRFVTWPARQLWAQGQQWLGSGRTPGARLAGEQAFLQGQSEEVLERLRRRVSDQAYAAGPAQHVWRALVQQLEDQREVLLSAFHAAAEQHHEHVTREIHAAAEELYQKLRKSPALLNTLRSARATADVAGVVLAVKTFGLSVHDALLAPAMLAVTSLLTEGALGAYTQRIQADLKQKQLADARDTFIGGSLAPQLLAVRDTIVPDTLTGITPDELAQAAAARQQWETATP